MLGLGLMVSACLLGAGTPASTPDTQVVEPSKASLEGTAPKPYWNQVRRVTELLATEEGTLTLFRENASLANRFASSVFFNDLIKKWRPRIIHLPEWGAPTSTELFKWELRDDVDSQTVYLTIYHKNPPDTFTILRTTWQGNQMTDIAFMRGFTAPFQPNQTGRNSWGGGRYR